MSEPSRTLSEIRSDACNKILVMLQVLGACGLAIIVARFLEAGPTPIMAVYAVLYSGLTFVTLRRHRLGLAIRAATVIAIPFVIGLTSIVSTGRLGGTLMYFVSACVLAGCFFGRRIAYGTVAFCLVTLLAVFTGFRFELLTPFHPTEIFTLTM